jgi:hypothetical protein
LSRKNNPGKIIENNNLLQHAPSDLAADWFETAGRQTF